MVMTRTTPTKRPMIKARVATTQKRLLIWVMLVDGSAANALAAAVRREPNEVAPRITSRRAARIAAPYTAVL
jgi:hypothetical protein